MEADHLDFFKDLEDIKRSFRRFAELVPSRGSVIVNADNEGARGIACVKDMAGSAFEGCGLCLYLCSHSAPEEVAAKIKGAQVSYYEYSPSGRRAAEIFTRHVKSAYPQPDLVDMAPTAARKDLSESKAPALLIQLGYHDNPQDEAWLVNSAGEIAASLAAAAADFMGVEP